MQISKDLLIGKWRYNTEYKEQKNLKIVEDTP
jgi:hypothetical protein